MIRSVLVTAFVLGQSLVLLVAGMLTLWYSSELMLWLIWMVGEERALGAGNVMYLEGGGRLLTNPSAMVRWMVPFWVLGSVQVLAAICLLCVWGKLRAGRLPRNDNAGVKGR